MDEESKKHRMQLQNKYEFLHPSSIQGGLVMSLGIECGDGWISILEDLFARINDELKKANLTEFKVVQVKEKFGDLVVYVHRGNDVSNQSGFKKGGNNLRGLRTARPQKRTQPMV